MKTEGVNNNNTRRRHDNLLHVTFLKYLSKLFNSI